MAATVLAAPRPEQSQPCSTQRFEEVDLGAWLRRWLEVHFADVALATSASYEIRATEAYVDSGEGLLVRSATQRTFGATYDLDLVVKWRAHHRLDDRVLAEARGRVKVTDISSTARTEDHSSQEEEDHKKSMVVEGDWQYKARGVGGPAADAVLGENGPKVDPDEAASEAERHLKRVVADTALAAIARRVAALRTDLADLAIEYDTRRRQGDDQNKSRLPPPERRAILAHEPLDPEAARRAEAATAAMVRDVKARLRDKSTDFAERLATLSGEIRCQDFRSMSLTDADVPAIVAALETAQRLESLDLSYNDLTDAGVQPLLVALARGRVPLLRNLRLDHTNISDLGRRQFDGLKALRRGLDVSILDSVVGEAAEKPPH